MPHLHQRVIYAQRSLFYVTLSRVHRILLRHLAISIVTGPRTNRQVYYSQMRLGSNCHLIVVGSWSGLRVVMLITWKYRQIFEQSTHVQFYLDKLRWRRHYFMRVLRWSLDNGTEQHFFGHKIHLDGCKTWLYFFRYTNACVRMKINGHRTAIAMFLRRPIRIKVVWKALQTCGKYRIPSEYTLFDDLLWALQ